jgi:hypothetical protein
MSSLVPTLLLLQRCQALASTNMHVLLLLILIFMHVIADDECRRPEAARFAFIRLVCTMHALLLLMASVVT